MAYLSQYGDDLFVSYAHVDDEAVSGSTQGWVTEAVKCLKIELARKLGRSDAYTLWVDHDLLQSQPVTRQILDRVERSAMLVVILSPAYIASDWCRREREAFFAVRREKSAPSVFVVEIDHIDDPDRPSELADFSPFRFWTRDPRGGAPRQFGWPRPEHSDHDYYCAIKDLAQAIADQLQRLKRSEPNGIIKALSSSPRSASTIIRSQPSLGGRDGCVFLAQVTDDLDIERSNVRRFLEQGGVRVVPTEWYSQEPSAFRKGAASHIEEADLFVQLLSGVAGKRPPDMPEGYLQCQLQLALDAGKPVLQWRSLSLETQAVEDNDLRRLLDGSSVRAEPIEDFKQAILRHLDDMRDPAPRGRVDAFVFVDMDSADRVLAENLCEILDRHGAGYVLPLETQDPGEYRRDLEDNLSNCDALMVIYGVTTTSWVRNHLRECHKALSNRSRPARGLALIQGPPSPKGKLPVRLPNMKVLDCQNGVDEGAIVQFLQSLKEGAV
jgi:hypothetical protein